MHENTEGQLIAIDGKTLRSSYKRGDRQSTIHMVNAFAEARKAPLGGLTFERNRGRIEARTYHVLRADDVSNAYPQWSQLKTLGMSMSFRQQQGKAPELTYRYHISSAQRH